MEPAEITEITLWTVITLGLYFTMTHHLKEKKKESGPKQLWVLEDNDADYEFLSMFCQFDNCYIKRFKSADHILWKFLFDKPDGLIVDYHLEGSIKGNMVIALCERFGVKDRLITGETKPIDGVPEEKVIRKGTGVEWCKEIQSWFNTEFA